MNNLQKAKQILGILALSIAAISGGAQDMHTVHITKLDDPSLKDVTKHKYENVIAALDSERLSSTYVIENASSTKSVAGYVLKWQTHVDGKPVAIRFEAFDRLHLIGKTNVPKDQFWISPNSSRLISPAISLSESEASRLQDITQLRQKLNLGSKSNTANPTAVSSATLDLIVFDDGTFTGPDERRLSKRFVAERNGRHDAGAVVLLAEKEGKDEAWIRDKLHKDVNSGKEARTELDQDLYLQARGRIAEQLLAIYDKFGFDAVRKNFLTFASLSKLDLERLPE